MIDHQIHAWMSLAKDRQQRLLQEAEQQRLLQEIKDTQTGWLSVQTKKAVNKLGRQLVDLGQRLENYRAEAMTLPDSGETCSERDWKAI